MNNKVAKQLRRLVQSLEVAPLQPVPGTSRKHTNPLTWAKYTTCTMAAQPGSAQYALGRAKRLYKQGFSIAEIEEALHTPQAEV